MATQLGLEITLIKSKGILVPRSIPKRYVAACMLLTAASAACVADPQPAPTPVTASAVVAPAVSTALAPTIVDLAYGDHPRQKLDFWKAESDKPTPIVFYMHGGGWVRGDKRDIKKIAYQKFLDAGISVVSINYRYSQQAQEAGIDPPVEWPMHDAIRALQFVRSKAAELNIDPTRVAISGESAGACSALWVAYHPDFADSKSSDAISRQSSRVSFVAVRIAQTTLDPKLMQEWTPNSRYGGHAFGFMDPKDLKSRDRHFAEFLAHREALLPLIQQYSPMSLATSDDPLTYMSYDAAPQLGADQSDPTHTANFGVQLQEVLRALSVESELVYPGAPGIKHANLEDFIIDRFKAQ